MIIRLKGFPALNYNLWGGFEGKTQELDNAVMKAAEMMEHHFGGIIEIRFNMARDCGGAWLDVPLQGCDVGIQVGLVRSQIENMTQEELMSLSPTALLTIPEDKIVITTLIDNRVITPGIKNQTNDYTGCQLSVHESIQAAADYLFNHTDMTRFEKLIYPQVVC